MRCLQDTIDDDNVCYPLGVFSLNNSHTLKTRLRIGFMFITPHP